MKVGFAKREITPPVGIELFGFIARLKPSEGVAEPLHVRAVVVESKDQKIALIQADLLGLAPWQVTQIRLFAEYHLGIPPHSVLISTTHTHSGPGMVPGRGGVFAPNSYQWEVIRKIQSALKEAHAKRKKAAMGTGSISYSMGINRRQETPHGVVLGFAPSKPRPETLEVARLKTSDQEILLFTHACHPYVLGGESLLISGDFPSLASVELEEEAGVGALFLQGCAGNISPQSAFQGIDKAREEGRRLAEAVRSARERLKIMEEEGVDGKSRLAHLPHVPLPDEKMLEAMAAQKEKVVRPEERGNQEVQRRIAAALQDWLAEMRKVLARKVALEPVMCEVQAIRIGGLTLLGIGGEPFFETGQGICAKSPSDSTWALGYTNSYCGYIPTRQEYPGGGYEVEDAWKYMTLWKTDERAEDRVIEAAEAVLEGVC